MLITRNGESPDIHPTARIAETAAVIGDVTIGAGAYVDHGVVIESGGPPVEIAAESIVFAGSVIRSVGGRGRPAFPVRIGTRTLVSPLSALTGCALGRNCYLATGAIVLQGAAIGDRSRIGAGAIVHAGTVLPEETRIGMRHIAAPARDGYLSTADVEQARKLAGADFFDIAFATTEADQGRLHDQVMAALLDEVHGWRDAPAEPPQWPRAAETVARNPSR